MIRFQITGETELAEALQGLPSRIKKDVAFAAMVKAVQPTVAAAQALAPVDSGDLRRSIGFAVRSYKRGATTYGIIGPRRGFGRDGREPANYAHLVEYGHATVVGAQAKDEDGAASLSKDLVGFVEARPFLRPAWDATRAQVMRLLQKELGEGVEAAAQLEAYKRGKRDARTRARVLKAYEKLAA